MYAGHAAVALALKTREPRLPMLPLALACYGPDWLEIVLGIDNLVFLTADVHYTAAHHYDPARAAIGDFTPFWEFVSGPLNAGAFPANALDGTFGPDRVFVKAPTQSNVSPAECATMNHGGTPAASSAPIIEPALVPTMRSAVAGSQPVSVASASSPPVSHAPPMTPPAPRTRPTLMGT